MKYILPCCLTLFLIACGTPRPTVKDERNDVRYFTYEKYNLKLGYYVESRRDHSITSTVNWYNGGEKHAFKSGVKWDSDGRITHYLNKDQDWTPFTHGDGVLPLAAFPIIAPQIIEQGELTYVQYIGAKDTLGETAMLKSVGNGVVQEFVAGKPTRSATIKNGFIIAYDWGGTGTSTFCSAIAEAYAGTVWEPLVR